MRSTIFDFKDEDKFTDFIKQYTDNVFQQMNNFTVTDVNGFI